MKKIAFLLLSLFYLNCLIAQQKKGIDIFNEQTGKEIIIKENKRVKIKTSDGVKISGRLKIIDNETILVKNEKIKLSQIEKIKRNPLIISILTNGILYYNGAALAGASILIYAITGNAASFLLTIPATAFIYGGIKSPNILKGYKATSSWKYRIIKIPK